MKGIILAGGAGFDTFQAGDLGGLSRVGAAYGCSGFYS